MIHVITGRLPFKSTIVIIVMKVVSLLIHLFCSGIVSISGMEIEDRVGGMRDVAELSRDGVTMSNAVRKGTKSSCNKSNSN